MEDPLKNFFRLAPGREVRLRYGYFITCQEVVKNDAGEIVELRCTYDPATRGGDSPDGRKVQGTIHWVSAARGVTCDEAAARPSRLQRAASSSARHAGNELPDDGPPHTFPPPVIWWRTGTEVA